MRKTDAAADERSALHRENLLRGLRYAIWIALHHAQQLDLPELQTRLTLDLVLVDALRQEPPA